MTDIQNRKHNITKYYESKPFKQKEKLKQEKNTIK